MNTDVGICTLEEGVLGPSLAGKAIMAVSMGNLTDEMVSKYIAEQESETVQDDSRFVIDNIEKLLP